MRKSEASWERKKALFHSVGTVRRHASCVRFLSVLKGAREDVEDGEEEGGGGGAKEREAGCSFFP